MLDVRIFSGAVVKGAGGVKIASRKGAKTQSFLELRNPSISGSYPTMKKQEIPISL